MKQIELVDLIQEESKIIFLTKGLKTTVDLEDFENFKTVKWYASKTPDGHIYAKNIQNRKSIFLHRLIMKANKNQIVDHINRDTLDNRKCNLRLVDCSLNNMNQKKKLSKISKYRGVSIHQNINRKKRWMARFQFKNKSIYLGYYETELEAHLAIKNKFIEMFGENHGYPLE